MYLPDTKLLRESAVKEKWDSKGARGVGVGGGGGAEVGPEVGAGSGGVVS